MSQKIIPNIWSNSKADETAQFYCEVFGGTVTHTAHYSAGMEEITGKKEGEVLLHEITILGQRLIIINGGSEFTPTPAISFMVNCRTGAECDALWEKLVDGGEVLMPLQAYEFSPRYGWLQDKYGVSWQLITATDMPEQELVPVLMFVQDNWGKAEEAMQFYVDVFAGHGGEAKVGDIARYRDMMPDDGTAHVLDKIAFANFWLAGQRFSAMDTAMAEHDFTFTPGISFLVDGDDQAEMDCFYDALSAVPEAEVCGWLQDKYGLSWQVSNVALEKMLQSGDKDAIARANQLMLTMKRLNIAELERAYKGE